MEKYIELTQPPKIEVKALYEVPINFSENTKPFYYGVPQKKNKRK